MDRKETIKILREIIRVLKDEYIFTDADFKVNNLGGGNFIRSKVQSFIYKKLHL